MKRRLSKCRQGKTYKVVELLGNDETTEFLANLGCKIGEDVTIISKLASNYIINIIDGRYGIDEKMAKLIVVEH